MLIKTAISYVGRILYESTVFQSVMLYCSSKSADKLKCFGENLTNQLKVDEIM